jgi:hypothetical protein
VVNILYTRLGIEYCRERVCQHCEARSLGTGNALGGMAGEPTEQGCQDRPRLLAQVTGGAQAVGCHGELS